MGQRKAGFFARLIDTKAIFSGDVKHPEQLGTPKSLLVFFACFLIIFVLMFLVMLAFFIAPQPFDVKTSTRKVTINACYVRILCEDPRFFRTTFTASTVGMSNNETVSVDGRFTNRCERSLCLEPAFRPSSAPIEFILSNSVLDLTGFEDNNVDFPVVVSTNPEHSISVSKVFVGRANYTDLQVNITKGIVVMEDTKAHSATVSINYGSLIFINSFNTSSSSSNSTTTNATTGSDGFRMTGEVLDNNYCISPRLTYTASPLSSCTQVLSNNGTTINYRCPFYGSFIDPLATSSSFVSEFHFNVTSLYVNELPQGYHEANWTAITADDWQPRIPGEGMQIQPTIDPDVITMLNDTATWQLLNPVSTAIQGVEVVTPALGTLFLHSSSRILMELTPDWVAFNTLFALRPQYRRLYTTLSHYECPTDPFATLVLMKGVTEEIYLFSKDYNLRDSDDLALLSYGHFSVANQYAISKEIYDAVGNPTAIVTATNAFHEIPNAGDTSPRGFYLPRVFALDDEGRPTIQQLPMTWVTITILTLQFLTSLWFIIIIIFIIVVNRNRILQSYLLIDPRSTLRNFVGFSENCPYSYFMCTLSVLTWFSFRTTMYLERTVYSQFYSGNLQRFLANYFEKNDATLDEHRAASHKMSRNVSLDAIKAQFDRWAMLRFYHNKYRHEEVCDAVDKFGGRRVVDNKYVVLGLARKTSVKRTAAFALELDAIQNFYTITRKEHDAVLVDELYIKAVVTDPQITEEAIVQKLREWRFKVVQRPTNIVIGIKYKAFSREGLLSEEMIASLVDKIEMNLTATPAFWYLNQLTGGPRQESQKTSDVVLGLLKFAVLCFIECIILVSFTFGPYFIAFAITTYYDAEFERYSTTNSVLTPYEFPASIMDLFHRPRTHTWLATIIGCTAVLFFALATFEPLGVIMTYKLVPQLKVGRVSAILRLIPRYLASAIIGLCYTVMLCFYLWYFSTLLMWWVLGAIIEPNTMLVYAVSAYTFIALVYTTYTTWDKTHAKAKQQLQTRVLESILRLIRSTPAAQVFGSETDNMIGGVGSAAATGAASVDGSAGGDGTKRVSASTINAGLVMELLSDDVEKQKKAINDIAGMLHVPDCALYLPLALVTKKARNIRRAVESTFDEVGVPLRFAPLATQLTNQLIDLPVSANEVAHSFYALLPDHYNTLLQYDDTITELVHAALSRNLTTTTLVQCVESVAASQLSRILDVPTSLLHDGANAIHAAYEGKRERCMHQLASMLVTLDRRVPENPPEMKLLYQCLTEFALLAAGRPNNLREVALEAITTIPGLKDSPIVNVIEPLFDGSESAYPDEPDLLDVAALQKNVDDLGERGDDASVKAAAAAQEQVTKHGTKVAKYLGRMVMKLAEIEFLLSPDQVNLLRGFWTLLRGDTARLENMDKVFRRAKPKDTFLEGLKVFDKCRLLILLRGEILYRVSTHDVTKDLLESKIKMSDLSNKRGIITMLRTQCRKLDATMDENGVVDKTTGSTADRNFMNDIMLIAGEMETIEEGLFQQYQQQADDGFGAVNLEMWLADQWAAIATITSFAPALPDEWCDYSMLETRAALPSEALRLVRHAASLVREAIVQLLPAVPKNKLHGTLCHFLLLQQRVAQNPHVTTSTIDKVLANTVPVTADEVESQIRAFLDDAEILNTPQAQKAMGKVLTPQRVLDVIRELSSVVFADTRVEDAKNAMKSQRVDQPLAEASEAAHKAAEALDDDMRAFDALTFDWNMMMGIEDYVRNRVKNASKGRRMDMSKAVMSATLSHRAKYVTRVESAVGDAKTQTAEELAGVYDDDEDALKVDADKLTEKPHSVVSMGTEARVAKEEADAFTQALQTELISVFSMLAQLREPTQRREELIASLKQISAVLVKHKKITFSEFDQMLRLPGGNADVIELLDDIVDYFVDRNTRGISHSSLASIFAVGEEIVELVLRPENVLNRLLGDYDIGGLRLILDVLAARTGGGSIITKSFEQMLEPFLRRIGLRTNVRALRRKLQWFATPLVPPVYFSAELVTAKQRETSAVDAAAAAALKGKPAAPEEDLSGNGAARGNNTTGDDVDANAGAMNADESLSVSLNISAARRTARDEAIDERHRRVVFLGELRDAYLRQRESTKAVDEDTIIRTCHAILAERDAKIRRKSTVAQDAEGDDAAATIASSRRTAVGDSEETLRKAGETVPKTREELRALKQAEADALSKRFVNSPFAEDVEELLEARKHYARLAAYLRYLGVHLKQVKRDRTRDDFDRYRRRETDEVLSVMKYCTPFLWSRVNAALREHHREEREAAARRAEGPLGSDADDDGDGTPHPRAMSPKEGHAAGGDDAAAPAEEVPVRKITRKQAAASKGPPPHLNMDLWLTYGRLWDSQHHELAEYNIDSIDMLYASDSVGGSIHSAAARKRKSSNDLDHMLNTSEGFGPVQAPPDDDDDDDDDGDDIIPPMPGAVEAAGDAAAAPSTNDGAAAPAGDGGGPIRIKTVILPPVGDDDGGGGGGGLMITGATATRATRSDSSSQLTELEKEMKDAFSSGSPFALLKDTVSNEVREIFGVLTGFPQWYLPHLPRAYSAIVTAVVQRDRTSAAVLDILAAVFPMKLRRTVTEIFGLAMQRVDTPVLGLADLVGIPEAKLRMMRHFFFAPRPRPPDLTVEVNASSTSALLKLGALFQKKTWVSKPHDVDVARKVMDVAARSDEIRWLSVLRAIAACDVFELLKEKELVHEGLLTIAMMAAPSNEAYLALQDTLPIKYPGVNALSLKMAGRARKAVYDRSVDSEQILPALRRFTNDTPLAPATHMLAGALHLFRANYRQAVTEFDAMVDRGTCETILDIRDRALGRDAPVERNDEVDRTLKIHAAAVRLGVQVARMIKEDGQVLDTEAAIQAAVALGEALAPLLQPVFATVPAIEGLVRELVPWVCNVIRERLHIHVKKDRMDFEAEDVDAEGVGAINLRLDNAVEMLTSAAAAGLGASTAQLVHQESMQSLHARPLSAAMGVIGVQSSDHGITDAQIDKVEELIKIVIPFITGHKNVSEETMLWKEFVGDVTDLVKVMLRALNDVVNKHSTLPTTMKHVTSILREAKKLYASAENFRDRTAVVAKVAEVAAGAPAALDSSEAATDLAKSTKQAKAQITKAVTAGPAVISDEMLDQADRLIEIFAELHAQRVHGVQLFAHLLRYATSVATTTEFGENVVASVGGQKVKVARQSMLTPEEYARFQLVLSIAQGDFTGIGELIHAAGVDVSADGLQQLQFVLKTVNSMRALANGSVDFSEVSTSDVLQLIAAQIFKELDANASGQLSFEEFHIALGRMHMPLSEAEARQWFNELDADANGSLTFAEFQEAVKRVRERYVERLLAWLNLNRESMYVALTLLGIWLAFLLGFIVMGAYGFTDGSIFTSCITGIMPIGGLLSGVGGIDFDGLITKIDEAAEAFFERLTQQDADKEDK